MVPSNRGNRCKICDHPARYEIDKALTEGNLRLREISKLYGIDDSAVSRHRVNHVLPALAHLERDPHSRLASARNILAELEECWRDVELIRRKVRPLIEDAPDGSVDVAMVDSLLKAVAQARGNAQTHVNVATLAMEWERREAEKSAAVDSGDALSELVLEAFDAVALEDAFARFLVEVRGLTPDLAAKVTEGCGEWFQAWALERLQGDAGEG